MFGLRNHWTQVEEQFERQFEPESDHFLYRRNQKGPPIRVTSSERDRFISEYVLRLRRGTRGMVGGMILLTGLAVWWIFQTGSDVPVVAIYASMGAMIAVLIGYTLWAWGAPARELARRMPIGRERTRAEVSRIWLKSMSYGRLAGTALAGVLALLSLGANYGGFAGWGLLWIALALALGVGAVIQAYRKWRFEREG